MARAKRQSDEIYNQRRRAKRLAARIQRDIAAGKIKEVPSTSAFVRNLEKRIEQTYSGRDKAKREKAVEASERLRSLTKQKTYTAEERRSIITAANLSQAASGKPGSAFSQFEAKIFWRATQHIWEGQTGNRFQMIMNYFGTDDLSAIMSNILFENAEAIAAYRRYETVGQYPTDDPRNVLQSALSAGADEDAGSPSELTFVNPVYRV